MIFEDSSSNATGTPTYNNQNQSVTDETASTLHFDSSPESGRRFVSNSRSGKNRDITDIVVVNGTHLQLPGDKYSPAYFVKVLEEREQVMYDYIDIHNCA